MRNQRIEFRIDIGGIVIVVAFLAIGLITMSRHPLAGLMLGGLTIASLLLHECGHMIAARVARVKVKEAGICLKGTYIRRSQSTDAATEMAISLSGPMMNTLIAAVLWSSPGLWHLLAIVNLVLSIGNLAPLRGSDGYHALTAWNRAAATARVASTTTTTIPKH